MNVQQDGTVMQWKIPGFLGHPKLKVAAYLILTLSKHPWPVLLGGQDLLTLNNPYMIAGLPTESLDK